MCPDYAPKALAWLVKSMKAHDLMTGKTRSRQAT